MAFPQTIAPAVPAGTDSPATGDDELRDIKQLIIDLFGVPASPSSVSAAYGIGTTDGIAYDAVRLTNKTGGALAAGDVVGIDTANNAAVALADTQATQVPLVVSLEAITNNNAGLFAKAGRVETLKTTGTVTRGDFVRKASTTLVAETTGTAISATASVPAGAFGVALSTAASNVCKAYLFGFTAPELPGAGSFLFEEVSAPSSPAANKLRLYVSDVNSLTVLESKDSAGTILRSTAALDRDVTVNEVVSSSTETTVYTVSVPANTMGVHRMLRLTLYGDYLNNSGGNTIFTVRVKYGGVTFATHTWSAIVSSATRHLLIVHAELSALNATGTQCGWSMGSLSAPGISGADNVHFGAEPRVSAASAVSADSTAAQTFLVSFEHDTNAATVSGRCQVAHLELVQ